jgi:hypothetical protein
MKNIKFITINLIKNQIKIYNKSIHFNKISKKNKKINKVLMKF